jgi:hypothetical protein
VEAAWTTHKAELLQRARPGRPLAWFWFSAPMALRVPLGLRPDARRDDDDDPDETDDEIDDEDEL